MYKLFSEKYQQIILIGAWLIIAIIHFAILMLSLDISWETALMDAFVFNSIFALISIGLWFVVINSHLIEKLTIDLIITHISVLIIAIGLWIFLSTHILNSLYSDNNSYLLFLKKSFSVRIIIGVIYYILNILFFFFLKTIEQLKDKEEREKQINILLKNAELDALKSQINPHFLFNSLNSINALTQSDPAKASNMILKLSDYMRYSLNQSNDILTSLSNEISHIEKYLEIEKVRFGKKLNYSIEISDGCLEMDLPPVLLQPLFENAIKHGLYSLIEGFFIKINITNTNQILQIIMTNNFDSSYKSKETNGLGINNLTNRLLNIYGRIDLCQINKETNLFTITIKIPQYDKN